MSKEQNASAESCHRGYRIYHRKRYETDPSTFGSEHKRGERRRGEEPLYVINIVLTGLGYDAISLRTYGNYRKNWDRGVHPDDYSPINRTDYNVPRNHDTDVPNELCDAGRDQNP